MLDKIISAQYRRPAGVLGWWIGRLMARQHVPENQWTVALLDAQPADRILEIGFGPGIAIRALSRQVTDGLIAGVDVSRVMVAAAHRRNRRAIKTGRVDLRLAEASALPFADHSFDTVYSIHGVYFWTDLIATLSEIRRVLRPDGRLILTFMPRDKMGYADDEIIPENAPFKPYSGAQLCVLLHRAGFNATVIHSADDPRSPSSYAVLAVK